MRPVLSKIVGLFHRAISQSGTALHWWGFTNIARERAFRLGQALGCNTNNSDELFEFLQEVPAKDIVEVISKTSTKAVNTQYTKFKHVCHLRL
jgi:carboxylesterase type B